MKLILKITFMKKMIIILALLTSLMKSLQSSITKIRNNGVKRLNPVIFINALLLVKHPIISLDYADKWADKISKMKLQYKGIKENKHHWFDTLPSVELMDQWENAINELCDAQDWVIAHGNQGTETRDIKWEAAYRLAQKVKNNVEDICYENLEQAGEIAGDAYMKLTVLMGRKKRPFYGESKIEGQVILHGTFISKRQATDWECSTDPDDPKKWHEIDIPPTLAAQTKVNNLPSDTEMYFHERTILKDGPTEFGRIIKVRVK